MPNPIDSENVIAWLNVQIEKVQGGWLHDYGFPTNVIAALTDVKRFVKNLPTIEAETVRHGRWETIDPSFAHVYCSECGAAAEKKLAKRYKGCPFCLCVIDATDTNVGGKGGADNG